MNLRIKRILAVILALIIISITSSVFAVDVTVGNLSISGSKTVQQGQEFTVKINLSNFQTSASTVTIIGKIEYDKEKLEYISNSISSNTAEGWDDVEALGEQCFKESNMGFLFENRTPKKIGANSNFLTLKFKAKSNVEGNANIKVIISSVSDATNFNGSTMTVAINKPATTPEQQPEQQPEQKPEQQPDQEPEKEPDQEQGQEPEKGPDQEQGQETEKEPEQQQDKQPDKTPEKQPDKVTDKTDNDSEKQPDQEQGQETEKDSEEVKDTTQKEDNNKQPVQYVGEDNTVKEGKLPKTGENYFLIGGVIVCACAVGIVLFIYIKRRYIRKNRY